MEGAFYVYFSPAQICAEHYGGLYISENVSINHVIIKSDINSNTKKKERKDLTLIYFQCKIFYTII